MSYLQSPWSCDCISLLNLLVILPAPLGSHFSHSNCIFPTQLGSSNGIDFSSMCEIWRVWHLMVLQEILNLLALGGRGMRTGHTRVLQVLRSSRRNIDYFQEITEQMAVRGHIRTAMECQSKAKSMWLQYKGMVSHNNRSGTGCVEFPYFQDLDSRGMWTWHHYE